VSKAEGAPEFFRTVDEALEVCEEQLLAKHLQQTRNASELLSWLTEAFGNREDARKLIVHLKPATVFDGNCLCHQGEPSDTLLFIEHGRVSVTVERRGLTPLRVRVFGPHTLVGEIGFFFHVPRTATVQIEAEAIVWALDQETYQRIKKSEPGLAAALLTYVVQLQAERLSFTTRQIAALQR
jgi:sulfate permease, SulP family